MNMGRTFDSDVNDEKYRDFYGPAVYCPEWDSHTIQKTTADTYSIGASKEWLEDWLVRTCELIDISQKFFILTGGFTTIPLSRI